MNRSLLRNLGTLCAMLVLATNLSFAQTARIQNQIVSQKDAPPTMGRDFWFGIPSNMWGQGQDVYLRLYITSPDSTTAYIARGTGTPEPVPVAPYKVTTYDISPTWELQSSGEPEQAVHVWSNDANLNVYFMNHAFATADGTLLIPTTGWGNDYVVAGYASLYEGNADYPSEFTIAASTDSTDITITPSCDLRLGSNPDSTAFRAGQTYTFTFQRGEAMLFLSVQARDVTGYDVTGTRIHSNHAVGVIGGSMCTNIPLEYPYCDHVEHMLPPLRTWGTTYYSTYFTQPAGQPGHDYGDYKFISSKAGQQIWDFNATQGKTLVTTISSKYGVFESEYEKAQKFWSDAPFLVIEYVNGSSYPDNINGYGDPAEVVVCPREQYAKTVVFQAPAQMSGLTAYSSYASVIVNTRDTGRTIVDGASILRYANTSNSIDDTFKVFTVPVKPGTHVVTGDTAGVAVCVYGYGFDESYAWSGALGIATYDSPDTVAPKVTITGACDESFVHLADAGVNPGGIPQSKLSSIQFDSSFNMSYTLDPNWQEGSGADTSGYSISVVDQNKPAYLSMEIFDAAGNRTQVVSTYTPSEISIQPATLDFGTDTSFSIEYGYLTVIDSSTEPFLLSTFALSNGNVGFAIDSGLSPSILQPGEVRKVKIAFQPKGSAAARDTLMISDGCYTQRALLIGNSTGNDFSVTDQHWVDESIPAPQNGYIKAVTIQNLSHIPITIDSAWWPDTHFVAVSTLPVTVPAQGNVAFQIAYFPDDSSAHFGNRTQGHWTSPQVLESDGITESIRTNSLIGNAAEASVANGGEQGEITLFPNPTTGMVVITGASGAVEVENVLGERQFIPGPRTTVPGTRIVDLSRLSMGTYFVRVTGKDGRTTIWRIVKQ